MQLRSLFVLLLFVCLAPRLLAQETAFHTLTHEEQERTYTLHIPADLAADAAPPLVIVLHSASSSGKAVQAISGFDAEADAHGFIVAYPDALIASWDDYRSRTDVSIAAVDDVGFLKALIARLTADHSIDPAQVHLIGVGNGGTFTLRAACEAADTFASFTIVAAQMWSYQAQFCPAATVLKPLLFVHGLADASYPIDGKSFERDPHSITPLNATLEFWRERYGCGIPQGLTDVSVIFVYADCRGGGLTAYVPPFVGGGWYRGAADRLNPGGPDYTALISAFITGGDWQTHAIRPEPGTPAAHVYALYPAQL